MLSDITIGQYYKADSLVHKLDARTKLLLTLWFIIIIFLCKNFLSLILVMAFVFVAGVNAQLYINVKRACPQCMGYGAANNGTYL